MIAIAPLTSLSKTAQPMQASLRFSGDAFAIYQELKALTSKPKKAQKPSQPAIVLSEDDAFKAICDTVVWQKGNKTLTIADMVAFLCRKRKNKKGDITYPGYGTVKTLAKCFPGMADENVKALRRGFEKLYKDNYYLGKDYATKEFWLRPKGWGMIQKLYPNITLPPEGDLFTSDLNWQH